MILDLLRAGEELAAELSREPDPVARNEEEKGISLRQLATVLADASAVAEQVQRPAVGVDVGHAIGCAEDGQ